MPLATVPLVPKNEDGVLRVIIVGRISTVHQNIENIDASYREVETFLDKIYRGRLELKHLGERASGMLRDRATILEAAELIATGAWDLVIAEDLSRFHRNPRYQSVFVQEAVDHDTRVICIGDHLDTADEDWEIPFGAATLRHSLHIPDTRRRVRRTAVDSFHKGGMVAKYKFGYRKLSKEEAEGGAFGPKGLRIARLDECTAIIRELRRRAIEGEHYTSLADWLNSRSVAPGPYVKEGGKWNAKLVESLLRDPILCGVRTHRKVISKMIYRTGKHKSRKNPNPPESQYYPELAHMSVQEHEELIAAMDERAATYRRDSGPGNPLYNRPRSRAFWPALHARCAICGSLMYRCGRDLLKCANSYRRGPDACWNRVLVSCGLTRERLIAAVLRLLEEFPDFRRTLADSAWSAIEAHQCGRGRSKQLAEKAVADLRRQEATLAKAISQGGQLEALVDELTKVQEARKAAEQRLADTPGDTPACLASRQTVEAHLDEAIMHVAEFSYEFADLMRRLNPEFVIRPVQALDSGLVRPRAEVRIALSVFDGAEPCGPDQGREIPNTRITVDLFDPPVHIREAASCTAEKRLSPGWSLKELALRLGSTLITVKRALAYGRLMEQQGQTEPYRKLDRQPESASRWKKYH